MSDNEPFAWQHHVLHSRICYTGPHQERTMHRLHKGTFIRHAVQFTGRSQEADTHETTRKSHLYIKVYVEDCTGYWKRVQTEGYWKWWWNCVWQEHQFETAVCCIVKNRTWTAGNITWALLWPQDRSGSRPFVKPLEEIGCKVSGCLTKDICKAVQNHNSSPESAFWVV